MNDKVTFEQYPQDTDEMKNKIIQQQAGAKPGKVATPSDGSMADDVIKQEYID